MQHSASRLAQLITAAKHGAYLGLKWTTLLIGPVLVVGLLIMAGITTHGVIYAGGRPGTLTATEFQWKYLEYIGGSIGAVIVTSLWAVVADAIVAVFCQLVRPGAISESSAPVGNRLEEPQL